MAALYSFSHCYCAMQAQYCDTVEVLLIVWLATIVYPHHTAIILFIYLVVRLCAAQHNSKS